MAMIVYDAVTAKLFLKSTDILNQYSEEINNTND